MHINGGGGDARSAVVPAPFFSRDSASVPPDHPSTPLWDRQVFSREKLDRLDRDRYAKKEWAPENRSSSGRSSAVPFANRGVAGRRRVLGRHAFENGRQGNTGGQNLHSPPENGKAEKDFCVTSGGHSPGYSGSPTSEKPGKGLEGHYLRDLHGSNPRFDSHPRQLLSQNGVESPMSCERENSKISGLLHVWEASPRERDLRERAWSRPEYCKRTGSLPKLDSSRDWSHGDRNMLEGRIDRYSNTSSREAAIPDMLNRDHFRYDWRGRDRSLFSGLSPWSTTRASTNNSNRSEVGTPSSSLEMTRVVSPPALRCSVSLDSCYNDTGLASPRKRPRLAWGQGLAKYEKEKTEEEPSLYKKSEEERCHESDGGACEFEKIGNASPFQDNTEKGLGSVISGASNKGVREKEDSTVGQAASRGLEDLSGSRNVDGCHCSAVAFSNVRSLSCSDLHDVHAFLESYHRENPSVHKDVVTQYVERVEVQIELAEKEMIKLENDYGIHIPRVREDAASTELFPQDLDMTPCLKESVPQSHPTSKDEQGFEDLDMVAARPETSFICESASHQGDHDPGCQDVLDIIAEKSLALDQYGKLEEEHETGSKDVLDVIAENSLALYQYGQLDEHEQRIGRPGKPGEDEEMVGGLEGEQRIAWPGEGERSIAWLEEDIVSRILHSNQKAAERSSGHFRHLICSGLDVLRQNGRLYGSPEEVDSWKLNEVSFLKKRKFLELKVSEERAITSFSEKVLAVKYMALRERWKPQKQAVQNFHIAYERSYLTMPTMYVGEREAVLHRFQTKNGLVQDPVAAEQERKAVNPWSVEERKIFLDNYVLFGKDFRKISTFLVHKTVADCIEFYYRNQKTEAFKEVRRQNQLKQCRDARASDVYLATARAVNGRHYEKSSVCMEGLSLVAEAAAAISTPSDYYTRTSRGFVTKLCFEECLSTRLNAPGKGGNKDKSGGKGVRSAHGRARAETSSHWSEIERELFMDALLMYGKDFQSISRRVGSKSEWQCQTFYSRARRRLGLDELVERHKATVEALEVREGDEMNMEPLEQLDHPPLVEDNAAKTMLCGGHTLMHQHEGKESTSPLGTFVEGKRSYVALEPPHGNCNDASINNVKTIPEADTARPDTSFVCPMDNLLKQESCITFNGEKQAMVSGCCCSATGVSLAPYSSVEKSLVCRETLEFNMDPVKVEAEPTLATISLGSGTCEEAPFDAVASHRPGLLSAAKVPNSLPTTTAPMTHRKEPFPKAAMETTKVRREPTSWTQDEKDKFLEVLKIHGKNWDRLRDSLPGKSLTQIKTYFQNSKAKLGFGLEGGNGRVRAARKRKMDDSDSSSNAGSGGQVAAAPKGPIYSEGGSLKVSSGFRAPPISMGDHPISMGGNGLTAEQVHCTNLFGRSDSANAPQALHTLGVQPNTSTAGIHPLFNSSVFPSPNSGAPQQSYVHPGMVTSQQIMNFPQPQQVSPSLVALQQPVASVGFHQTHQLEPPMQPGALMFPELASIAVQHHLHKQPVLPQAEALQPQVLQRQHPQLHPQLPISAHVSHHHFQPILGQHQGQSSQQISSATPNQLQQGSNVSSLLASTSQSSSAAHQLQQHVGLLQSQLYHMHAKAPSSLPSLLTSQLPQLQVLQLHWRQQQQQQQQAQVQQPQVMQGQLPHMQQSSLIPLNDQQQQTSVMRGAIEVMSGCSEAGKCQTPSASQLPAADIKLFGQSLLSQPTVEQTGRLCCSSSAQEALPVPSASLIPCNIAATSPQTSVDAVLPGQGQHLSVSLLGHGYVSILAGSASVHLGDTASEQNHSSAQEAVARINERLVKEPPDMEDVQTNEATIVSHNPVEQLPESSVGKDASIDLLRPQNDANTNNKCRLQDRDSLLPAPASGQAASQGLPRVVDALVALAEWRLQNANGGTGRITDEFLSQSWEALQRDPVSLVEAGKAGGSLAHIYTSNGDVLQHLKDGLCSWQSHLLHPSDPQRSLASANAHRAEEPRTVAEAGDACGSGGAVG